MTVLLVTCCPHPCRGQVVKERVCGPLTYFLRGPHLPIVPSTEEQTLLAASGVVPDPNYNKSLEIQRKRDGHLKEQGLETILVERTAKDRSWSGTIRESRCCWSEEEEPVYELGLFLVSESKRYHAFLEARGEACEHQVPETEIRTERRPLSLRGSQ